MNNSIVCQSKAFWLHILLVVGSMSSQVVARCTFEHNTALRCAATTAVFL